MNSFLDKFIVEDFTSVIIVQENIFGGGIERDTSGYIVYSKDRSSIVVFDHITERVQFLNIKKLAEEGTPEEIRTYFELAQEGLTPENAFSLTKSFYFPLYSDAYKLVVKHKLKLVSEAERTVDMLIIDIDRELS